MLMRVVIGIVILSSAFLIWEGLNEVLFNRLEFLDAGAGRLLRCAGDLPAGRLTPVIPFFLNSF